VSLQIGKLRNKEVQSVQWDLWHLVEGDSFLFKHPFEFACCDHAIDIPGFEDITVKVFPGGFQLLIITRHDSNVINLVGSIMFKRSE
jgi:hypothetical protein